MPFDQKELISLLSNTDALINQVYWFEQKIEKPKAASHRGSAITYVDIMEKRDDFLRELKSTMLNWVYSNEKYESIYSEELTKRNNDELNTNAYLFNLVQEKFRKGHPQGQFGELLLFNFIQYFFSAPPLLRKMSITTNPKLERNGADAIHYFSDGEKDVFILGESKCYESKYSFNKAIEASVSSIVESFNNIDNELILYLYDDFVNPALEKIAKDFKDGKSKDARIELVCLIAYNETTNVDDESEEEIKNRIKECILDRCASTNDDIYKGIRASIVSRIHYIIFPFWQLDKLLKNF